MAAGADQLDRLEGVDEAQEDEEDGDGSIALADEAQVRVLEQPPGPVGRYGGRHDAASKAKGDMAGNDEESSNPSEALLS